MWSSTSWLLAKDVGCTGAGLILIFMQAFSARPNDEILVVGLALTGLGASFHIGKLVSGRIDGRLSSSPRHSPAASSAAPSSSPEEGSDE